MELSICIVSFNVESCLKNCLASIQSHVGIKDYEVIVVDNDSRDGSTEMVKTHFSDVQLILNSTNVGFAGGMNQALQAAKGEFLFLLNPDTVLHDGVLETLIRYLKEHEKCAIAGPKLLNADGSIQNGLRRFPGPGSVCIKNTFLRKIGTLKEKINRYRMRDYDLNRSGPVDQVSGAAMLLKANVGRELHFLDPRFFIFFEEVDLCRRVYDSGFEVHYVSEATLSHIGGQSQNDARSAIKYIHLESELKYLKKYMHTLVFQIWLLFFKLFYILSIACASCMDGVVLLCYTMLPERKKKQFANKIHKRERKSAYRRFFIRHKMLSFIMTA